MLNFIVLGYIPGTSIQLSFYHYLLIVGGVALLIRALLKLETRLFQRKMQEVALSLMTR